MADKTVPYRPFPGCELSITGSASDIGVLGNIERTGGRYEEDVTALYRRFLKPDSVVVDGGANIGVLAVLAGTLAPRGRVYAFEPAPANVEHLRCNIAQNGLHNVEVVEVALTDRPGEVSFSFNEGYPAGSHLADADGTDATAITVSATSLDAWAAKTSLPRLDLVKIDVEGAEPAALAGARETISRFRPVLIVECNAGALRRVAGASFRDLYDVLASMYPTVAALSELGRPFPLSSVGDLELRLGHRGVVDLVGLPVGASFTDRALGRFDDVVLLGRHNRFRAPRVNYVVTPAVTFSAAPAKGKAGSSIVIPVTVVNRSRWWLSSDFVYEPVRLAYRIFDLEGNDVIGDGRRTGFAKPVAPGATVTVDAHVDLPDEAGDYELAFTLVQEAWAWLDDIDPACRGSVTLTVI